jgi:hypothetical protein
MDFSSDKQKILFAKKKALTCPKCGNKGCKKTGQRKKIERSRRALIASPIPFHDYEYCCDKCKHLFWSTIENIYNP